MATPNNQDPTADYRKYPKGPNFLGIVLGSCVFLIIAFIVAYIVLHKDAGKMPPHAPDRTPNSLYQPLLPGIAGPPLAA